MVLDDATNGQITHDSMVIAHGPIVVCCGFDGAWYCLLLGGLLAIQDEGFACTTVGNIDWFLWYSIARLACPLLEHGILHSASLNDWRVGCRTSRTGRIHFQGW
jgi:hypothetical protein